MSFIHLLVAGRRDGGVIDMDNVKWEEFGFRNPTDFLAAVERGIERGHLERDGDLLKLTVRGDATAALSPVVTDGLPPVGVRAKIPPPAPLPPAVAPPRPPVSPPAPPPLPPPPAAEVFVEEDTQPSKTKPVHKPHKPKSPKPSRK